MSSKSENCKKAIHRLLQRFAVDRKKTVLATALLLVMALMWFRVLAGRGPASARGGAPSPGPLERSEAGPPQVRYVELPNIPGRFDDIERDVFAGRHWKCFQEHFPTSGTSTGPEVPFVSSDQAEEVALRRSAQKLTLEAVLWSENPQAFVNDQLVHVGDTITVKDGQNTCEFEVLRIFEDSVLVGCKGTQLTLKLAQYLDVSP